MTLTLYFLEKPDKSDPKNKWIALAWRVKVGEDSWAGTVRIERSQALRQPISVRDQWLRERLVGALIKAWLVEPPPEPFKVAILTMDTGAVGYLGHDSESALVSDIEQAI